MKKLIFIMFFFFSILKADCVYGAKGSTSFKVLDSNTIILQGYKNILVKTSCFISSTSEVSILKDDFCDYDSNVLYIDGEACDVNQVRNLD